MLHKVYDDAKCVYVTVFAWAVNAKKSLINNNGFSYLYQCLFEIAIYPIPLMILLDKSNYSSDLAKHIYALYAARQAFILGII